MDRRGGLIDSNKGVLQGGGAREEDNIGIVNQERFCHEGYNAVLPGQL